MLNATDGLVKNQERNRDQGGRIHQRGQNSGAVIAISVGRTGRTRVEIHGNERQQQGNEIRQVVPGFREQSQRVCTEAGYYQQTDVSRRYQQGNLQDS